IVSPDFTRLRYSSNDVATTWPLASRGVTRCSGHSTTIDAIDLLVRQVLITAEPPRTTHSGPLRLMREVCRKWLRSTGPDRTTRSTPTALQAVYRLPDHRRVRRKLGGVLQRRRG